MITLEDLCFYKQKIVVTQNIYPKHTGLASNQMKLNLIFSKSLGFPVTNFYQKRILPCALISVLTH